MPAPQKLDSLKFLACYRDAGDRVAHYSQVRSILLPIREF